MRGHAAEIDWQKQARYFEALGKGRRSIESAYRRLLGIASDRYEYHRDRRRRALVWLIYLSRLVGEPSTGGISSRKYRRCALEVARILQGDSPFKSVGAQRLRERRKFLDPWHRQLQDFDNRKISFWDFLTTGTGYLWDEAVLTNTEGTAYAAVNWLAGEAHYELRRLDGTPKLDRREKQYEARIRKMVRRALAVYQGHHALLPKR